MERSRESVKERRGVDLRREEPRGYEKSRENRRGAERSREVRRGDDLRGEEREERGRDEPIRAVMIREEPSIEELLGAFR